MNEMRDNMKQDMMNRFYQTLTDEPTYSYNYRRMPRVKLKKPSKASEQIRQNKMEAAELKSSIARYLLTHISKDLGKKIPKEPFAKVIKLPQMLGYDEIDAEITFRTSKIQ